LYVIVTVISHKAGGGELLYSYPATRTHAQLYHFKQNGIHNALNVRGDGFI